MPPAKDRRPPTEAAQPPQEAMPGPAQHLSEDPPTDRAESWSDPPGAEVIDEFHRNPARDGEAQGIDEGSSPGDEPGSDLAEHDELDLWPQEWRYPMQRRVLTAYHKEGAPLLEPDSSELAPPRAPVRPSPPHDAQKKSPSRPPRRRRKAPTVKRKPLPVQEEAPRPLGEIDDRPPRGRRLNRALDLPTVEMLAYTAFRATFRHGVRYHIEKEGLIDWDLTIADKTVTVDANRLIFELPQLSIWRVVLAYQGRPVIEIGRGVKNGLRIHRWRLILVLLRAYLQRRRTRKH